MKTWPVVENVNVPAAVEMFAAPVPISPEVDARVTAAEVSVPDVRVIVPAPPAVRLSEPVALKSPSTVILPPAAVAMTMTGAVITAADEVAKSLPTVRSKVLPALDVPSWTALASCMKTLAPVVLAVKVPASVNIRFPGAPIFPLPDARLMVPAVRVAPGAVLATSPAPAAVMFMMLPAAPVTLPLTLTVPPAAVLMSNLLPKEERPRLTLSAS